MRNWALLAAVLSVIEISHVKAELSILFQDVEADELDNEYIVDFDGFVADNPEDGAIINFEIIKQLPEGIRGRLFLMGASMGEYVVATGVDYEMDFCEMLDEPIIMGRLLESFGFSSDKCPPTPGLYGTENYTLDMKTLPDSFPPNNYAAHFHVIAPDDHIIYGLVIYLRIY